MYVILSQSPEKYHLFICFLSEKWLEDYRVDFYNVEGDHFVSLLESNIVKFPTAKVIDIPNNDLMRFQQGAFLLLTDFALINQVYLTQNVRNVFEVKKYWISRSICADIAQLISLQTPWYHYDRLMDIRTAMCDLLHGK